MVHMNQTGKQEKKNPIEGLTLRILVMPYKDGYLSLCKETGEIRSGRTLEEARDAMFSATNTLIEAVIKQPEFAASFRVGLPLRYNILFNWTLFKMVCMAFFHKAMDNLLYVSNDVSTFRLQPMHG